LRPLGRPGQLRCSINIPNFGDFADPRKVAAVAAAAEQAGWDGAVPMFTDARHGHAPPVDQVRDLAACVRAHRDDRSGGSFEIVIGGASPADSAKAHDLIGPLVDAGATWWDERQLQSSDDLDRLAPVLRRIERGPPAS
jgi:hypothetical protein